MTKTTPRIEYGLNPSPPSYFIFHEKHFSFVFLATTCDDKELTSADDDWGEGGFTPVDATGVKPWLLQALQSFMPHLQAQMFLLSLSSSDSLELAILKFCSPSIRYFLTFSLDTSLVMAC